MVMVLRLVIALAIIFSTLTVANGATIYVNTTGWWFEGGDFNSSTTPIQSAVNIASDGDVIYLEPGHYYENINIVNKVVSLIGDGKPSEVIVEANSNDAVFYVKDTRDLRGVISTAKITLKNVTIVGKPYYPGIHVDDFYGYSGASNKNVLLENVSVTFSTSVASSVGIKIENSTYVTISKAHINKSGTGVDITAGSSVTIEHCKIESPSIYAPRTISIDGDSQALIRYNELVGGTLRIYYNHALVSIAYNEFDNSGTSKDCLYVQASSPVHVASNHFTVGSGKGIHLSYSSSNIVGNVITGTGGGEGIYVASGNGVYLDGNVVRNMLRGIYVSYSSSVTLNNNTMSENRYNFGVYDSSHDRLKTITVFMNNLADGKPIYYYVAERNLAVPSDASTVYCIDCVNVSASNLDLKNNTHGIFLYNCSNVVIDNTSVEDVVKDVYAYDCYNVSIMNTSINFSYVGGTTSAGTGIYASSTDMLLINNVSVFDKVENGARSGIYILNSNEVTVVDSKVVCHARPLVGHAVYVNSQNFYFENVKVEGGETYFNGEHYVVKNCDISGSLKLYGSYAQISNNELETTSVSASNLDISNNTFNGVVYLNSYSTKLKFENNTIVSSGSYALELMCKNSYVANNTLIGGYEGLWLSDPANGNVVFNNTITGCEDGIKLSGVTNNTLMANKVVGYNEYGIYISAMDFEDYLNYIDTSNTIRGKPILYLINESNKIYSGSYSFVGIVNCENVTLDVESIESNYYGVIVAYTNDSAIAITGVNSSSNYGLLMDHAMNNTIGINAVGSGVKGVYVKHSDNNNLDVSISGYSCGVSLEYSNNDTITGTIFNCRNNGVVFKNSNNNTITNVLISNCYEGIVLSSSDNNTIKNSRITSNIEGIELSYSDNNTITGNYIQNNYYGISLSNSNSNLIYDNYFSNTYWNARTDDSTNVWNVSKTAGTNLLSGNYLGGNYWSDYAGGDADGDGFGDTPYVIDASNIDYLPLVSTYHEIDILVLGTPVVNQSTLGILKVRFVNFSAGDPYEITIYDPSNAVVYQDSGTLTGNNVMIDVDWIPQTTGNHTIQAYAQGTINSNTVNVYQYAVVAPIPEIATLLLFSAGIVAIVALSKRRR